MQPELRYCPRCQEEKTLDNFTKGAGYCRPCAVITSREWRAKNAERAKELAHAAYIRLISTPEGAQRRKQVREKGYTRKYGTLEEREERKRKRMETRDKTYLNRTEKRCPMCEQVKPIEEFSGKRGNISYCKPCRSRYVMEQAKKRKAEKRAAKAAAVGN